MKMSVSLRTTNRQQKKSYLDLSVNSVRLSLFFEQDHYTKKGLSGSSRVVK